MAWVSGATFSLNEARVAYRRVRRVLTAVRFWKLNYINAIAAF